MYGTKCLLFSHSKIILLINNDNEYFLKIKIVIYLEDTHSRVNRTAAVRQIIMYLGVTGFHVQCDFNAVCTSLQQLFIHSFYLCMLCVTNDRI